MPHLKRLTTCLLALVMVGCTKHAHTAPYLPFAHQESPPESTPTPSPHPYQPPTREPDQPLYTPTPDAPNPLPTLRTEEEYYIVKAGDTLKKIGYRYQLLPKQIAKANGIDNPNLIYAGQQLILPAPTYSETGPDFKILPDSELVYGPYTVLFDVESVLQEWGGTITTYEEEVNRETLTGPDIIQLVASNYSVNPRLLIALLEHQSGWVTKNKAKDEKFPMGHKEAGYEGLYRQTAWAANQLNWGYYVWRVNGIASWQLPDGINVPINTTINAGTAGVQHFFSKLLPHKKWRQATSEDGLFATYQRLFGYPFDFAFQPLLPDDLSQPALQLPFEPGVTWAFTGGPHGGWDTGSAWAALDFAPPPGNQGCVTSDEWVVAAADGMVVRSDHGAVVQSLDGDPYEQTGWSLLYMHIEKRDRVETGTQLQAGDRIGHPSCEGGISTGTHLHIARRYNGEWIPADQDIPFNLGGWISNGWGIPYEGTLHRDSQTVYAEDRRTDDNLIRH
ncbi:MAG: LysM peptidoglycan-binding domain-containing M23 family metallopeptidase [Anaerolineales bacterium]